jgi:hypothetical protein
MNNKLKHHYRNSISLILLLILITGCGYKTTRMGYEESNDPNIVLDNCEVEFVRSPYKLNQQQEVVGSISLDESGFSTNCKEPDARLILKEEACLLGADVVQITNEKQPSFISSCYRVSAKFIKTNYTSSATKKNETAEVSDSEKDDYFNYKSENDNNPYNEYDANHKSSKSGSITLSVLGSIVGFAAGYLLVTLIMN